MAVTKIRKTSSWILLAAVVAVIFAVVGFFKGFKGNKKGATAGLGLLALLIVIMVISYALGSPDPIAGLNEDSQRYNTAGWLKVVDMCIYTIYALGALTIIAVLWNALKSAFSKK